jgi:hypothetical protein
VNLDAAGVVELDVAPSVGAALSPAALIDSGGTYTSSALITRSYWIGDHVPLTTRYDPTATRYEWEITHQQTKIVETKTTSAPSMTWTPTRAGHFIARVRACGASGCTAWYSTADAGFWMFAWQKPPKF